MNLHFEHMEDLFILKIVKVMLELEMDFNEFLLLKAIVFYLEGKLFFSFKTF